MTVPVTDLSDELSSFVQQATWVAVNDYEGKMLCDRTGHTLESLSRSHLKGVIVTETEVGDVRGHEGFYHYRQYSAIDLCEQRPIEDVQLVFQPSRDPHLVVLVDDDGAHGRDLTSVDVTRARASPLPPTSRLHRLG